VFNLSVKFGYNLTFCPNQDTAILCSESEFETFNFTAIQKDSFFKNIFDSNAYENSYQSIYYIPIANFLHTDYIFRLINSYLYINDVCTLETKLYKDYIFRFYRNCDN
jgi:hypothetical protein